MRGAFGEDLSHLITKVRPTTEKRVAQAHALAQVTFALHPSFVPPTRVLVAPPYEVTETGWGEFEIGITARTHTRSFSAVSHACAQIQLVAEAMCAPVELVHALKLYHEAEPPGPESAPDSAAQAARLLRPVRLGMPVRMAPRRVFSAAALQVVRKRYDELVFVLPPVELREVLQRHQAYAATAGEPLVAGAPARVRC